MINLQLQATGRTEKIPAAELEIKGLLAQLITTLY